MRRPSRFSLCAASCAAAMALSCAISAPVRSEVALGGSVRAEGVTGTTTDRLVALAVAPRLEYASHRPGTPVLLYLPSFWLERGPRTSWRSLQRASLAIEPARRAGLHPYFSASGDIGQTRRSDDASPDGTVERRPGVPVLWSYSAGIRAGLTGHRSRSHSMRFGLAADRSSGLGDQAAALPLLTEFRGTFRNENRLSRNESVETSGEVLYELRSAGESGLLARLGAGLHRRLSPELSGSVAVGVAAARRSAAPSATNGTSGGLTGGASLEYSAPGGRGVTGAAGGVRLWPEFDRLDGAPRQRIQGRAAIAVGLSPDVSLQSAAQWTTDLRGGGPLRRNVAVDAVLHLSALRESGAEIGARYFAESSAAGSARIVQNEFRVFVGWTTGSKGL